MNKQTANRRIGLTLREASATAYREDRDAIARDWYRFMEFALPEAQWILLPNLKEGILSYCERWGVDGLILTGGDDVGGAPVRDATETFLLDFSIQKGIPVLGVCRGLQMIQSYFGGAIEKCQEESHVGGMHRVEIVDQAGGRVASKGVALEVNSFHRFGVKLENLAKPLQAFAVGEDGTVEGLFHPGKKIAAVQWHPERYQLSSDWDRRFVRATLEVQASKKESS